MKVLLCTALFGLALSLFAQEANQLPEPSEPPFKVGDLPKESGYVIERPDAPDLNFRLVDNKMRLYWIDDDGLITEPEVSKVSVRFDQGWIRDSMRAFHLLRRLSDDTALGSSYSLTVPHRYYITILIKRPGVEALETHRFRYTPEMDEVRSPTTE